MTCLDGYQMARQGRAGPALAIAALASFFAGCVGTLLIALAGPPLGEWALKFGAAEYISLMLMALVASAVLTQGDAVKGLAMVVVGLLLGVVGADVNSGMARYTFGVLGAHRRHRFHGDRGGPVRGGRNRDATSRAEEAREVFTGRITGLMPTARDFEGRGLADRARHRSRRGLRRAAGHRARALVLRDLHAGEEDREGSLALRRGARSKAWRRPEAANNAAAQTAFIPMLTLGIPASATMALMLGAMMLQGIAPGPQVMLEKPDLFWGLIASMWIGNLLLVILNLPLVGIWVRLLTRALPLAVSVDHHVLLHRQLQREQQPVRRLPVRADRRARLRPRQARSASRRRSLLGYVLGPLMEENLRRAMLLARGDPTVFFTRPISLVFMIATLLILVVMVAPAVRGTRRRS